MPRPTRRPAALRALLALLAVVSVVGSGLVATTAQAAGQRLVLRMLLVSDGGPASAAFATELDRQGVPYTTVKLADAARPVITQDFLEDDARGLGRFQGVLLPNQAGGGLAQAELDALGAYEREYAVRQVNGYDFPTTTSGLVNQFSGVLDGVPAAVTPQGLAGSFRYLTGALTIDDFDPSVTEVFGYLPAPVDPMPAGTSYTPFVTATAGGVTGPIVGAYDDNGREQLVVTASMNQYMQWANLLLPGIVDWATRGVHVGYRRAYLNVQIDDVFLPDSRWSTAGNCTPGDDCVDAGISTPDIRMTAADVTRLVQWQKANGLALDMVYNAGGSDVAKAENGGTDALTTAFLAEKSQFRWINHTYSHPYLGCIQIAPTVLGQTWTCATSPTQQPRQDAEVGQQAAGGLYWASQAFVTDQVVRNQQWALANALPNFAADELVTGEHSGLRSLPQQVDDNPFLAPSLAAAGIRYTASDASREPDARVLAGGSTLTVPRHPMNIYYNTATFAEQIDEYNWYYTSRADGGSGICEDNPATSTCIAPLDSSSAAAAKASFDSYLAVVETRNALKFVLTNDPAPFYAHQSNLAEDGLLYPVLEGILNTYSASVDRVRSPLVQTGLAGQAQARDRLATWRSVASSVDVVLDSRGVNVPDAAADVPLTVPADSRGGRLEAYAGSLSGWQPGATTVALATPGAGYFVATAASEPGVPDAGVATAGSTAAALSWTAPVTDGGSPLTGYVVRAYLAGTTTLAASATVPATGTAGTVTGLRNGTAYQLTVAARNAIGESPQSTPSSTVTPNVAGASVPQAVTGDDGNASATVRWTAPAVLTGVTALRVRVYSGATTTAVATADIAPTRTSVALTGLTNGRAYTAQVTPLFGATAGTPSARTEAFTPSLTAQTVSAPSVVSVAATTTTLPVTWAAPQDAATAAATRYRVRAYAGATSTVAVKDVYVNAPATTTTLTGLASGTAYTVDVQAYNGATALPTSARSVAVTTLVPLAPGAPVMGTATSGPSGWPYTAGVTWAPPATDGGSPVTGYLVTAVRVDAQGREVSRQTSGWLSATTRTWSTYDWFLTTRLYFLVQARNAAGTSPTSSPSAVVVQQ